MQILLLYFFSKNKVTEYCPGGELFFHLKRLKRFKEREMKFYVAEIGCALAHLHALDVIYRDLKVGGCT